MTETAVVADHLRYRYPGRPTRALDDLSLEVAAGERVAVLGANGSGKTTFALHLNGLLLPDEGSVAVGGLPVAAPHLLEIRRRVGMVFQAPDDQLFSATVGDDVAFGPANLGLPRAEIDQRVETALEQVGAADLRDRTPHHLSGGEKRRAALATVLAMHPDVLVLDEPTAELDPLGRRELAETLIDLGSTQIVVTHDLPFALQTCARSVIFDGGRVVADGPTGDLLGDAALLARHRLELPFGFAWPPPTS